MGKFKHLKLKYNLLIMKDDIALPYRDRIPLEEALVIKKTYLSSPHLQKRTDTRIGTVFAREDLNGIKGVARKIIGANGIYASHDSMGDDIYPERANMTHRHIFYAEGGDQDLRLFAELDFFGEGAKDDDAQLYIKIIGETQRTFEEIAHILKYASDVSFPEGMTYAAGVTLLESNGEVRAFTRACCEIGHRH